MQEVLVVVGGRALEEDEEGGEEPSRHTGNFAFYNTKASKYLPCLSWTGSMHHLGVEPVRCPEKGGPDKARPAEG